MIKDIAKTASNSTGIIKLFLEPIQIKKISNATNESYAKSKSIVESSDEPAYISTNNYFVCNNAYSDILKKFGCSEGPMGAYQLNNIIKVLSHEKIESSNINENEVDFDIVMKIIDKIKFVSDDTLSKAWNKLLKNEIENKSKYSMRTIELLSHLSSDEANLFYNSFNSIFCSTGGYYSLFRNYDGEKNIKLLNLTSLIEAGFILNDPLKVTNGTFTWNGYYVITEGKINFFKLSQFGIDVYNLIEKNVSINDCKEELEKQKQLKNWSIHNYEGSTYNSKPLMSKNTLGDND